MVHKVQKKTAYRQAGADSSINSRNENTFVTYSTSIVLSQKAQYQSYFSMISFFIFLCALGLTLVIFCFLEMYNIVQAKDVDTNKIISSYWFVKVFLEFYSIRKMSKKHSKITWFFFLGWMIFVSSIILLFLY